MKAGGKRLISNFEAEQAVIGSIVLDPEKVMPVLLMDIQSDYFTCPEYRTLFEACKSLYGDSKAIDAVSLLSIVGSECKEIVLKVASSGLVQIAEPSVRFPTGPEAEFPGHQRRNTEIGIQQEAIQLDLRIHLGQLFGKPLLCFL